MVKDPLNAKNSRNVNGLLVDYGFIRNITFNSRDKMKY